MGALATQTSQIPVTIAVTDLERAVEFYADFFGLTADDESEPGAITLRRYEAEMEPLELRLVQRPRMGDTADLSMELQDHSELLDLHLFALMTGHRATRPRTHMGRLFTTVLDPDGNQVHAWSRRPVAGRTDGLSEFAHRGSGDAPGAGPARSRAGAMPGRGAHAGD